MKNKISSCIASLLVLVCCSDVLPGVGVLNTQSQLIAPNPGLSLDNLPVHLPVSNHHQPGYIIIPKSNFGLPKGNNPNQQGGTLNLKQNRRPGNIANLPLGKIRLPNNRARRPPQQQQNKPNQQYINGPRPALNQNGKPVIQNHPFQQRQIPKLNPQQFDATVPQNVKLDFGGPNRPPVIPNFMHQPPLPAIKPNEFLLNGSPPRQASNAKNQNGATSLSEGEGPHITHNEPVDELHLNGPILSQIEHGETLDIAHLLKAAQQENELLDSPELPLDLEGEANFPNHIIDSHNFDQPKAQALLADIHQHIAKAQSESAKQEEPSFHIPFPDFAEPEPGPPLKPSNFHPGPNHSTNNRIIPPVQHEQKTTPPQQTKAKNSDTFDHIQEESAPIAIYGQVLPPNEVSYGAEINNYHSLNDANSDNWPLAMPEMPKIIHLDVKCEKNLMRISLEFDKAFHGIIYSKGHFSYGRCVHLPAGSGHNSVQFDISINSCGMQGNSPSGHYGPTETGSYFENTVVVQYDPLVQEAWDQARKLRCNWHDQYEKTVTFRPFNVDMLQVVRADFAGDNVGCWMQIQVGKGPWASEVSGIVRIGQTMTLVLAIKDDESKFDMMVRNCIAHDGHRAPIELVDSSGCVTRPKIMSRFTKVKNFGSSASVLSFAHFQAFKFPDSTDVHIQCTVQICRHQCEEQCFIHRKKREAGKGEVREIGLNSILQVVAVEDLSFSPFKNQTEDTKIINEKSTVCMSASGFAASLILLLSIVIVSCLVAAFLFLKQRTVNKMPPMPYDLAVFKKHVEQETKKQQERMQKKL